jgi:hypothetical protein
MAMHFGKGYLVGGQTKAAPSMMGGELEEKPEGGDHTAMIHDHLKKMHKMTGEKHSHIEHHDDGSHSAHHVDEQGNVRGPEDSDDCPGGMCGEGEM